MIRRSMSAMVMMLAFLEGPSLFSQDDVQIYSCAAEAVWTNCPGGRRDSATPGQPVTLHLLAHVSRPAAECLGAWVDLTATYLNPRRNVVCSGKLEQIATMEEHSQELAFEIDPGVLRTFARWTNEPSRRADSPFEPLRCFASDGRTELLDTHLEEAVAFSVTAAVFPSNGGVATAECAFEIVR